ncbi:MAG: LacI family transcriptional regulator, partial [Spirochaetaceae bacterium]
MDKSKIITIKDIAQKSGVSIGTVDRVVHDRGRVSEETAVRVRKIIKEMGYRPNMFASRLSRAKVFRFGVLIPNRDQDSGYWEASLAGIEKAVKELAHYGVAVNYFFFDRYGPEHYMEKIGNKIAGMPLDGLLIAPVIHEPVVNLVQGLPKHLPYVFINTMVPELHPISFIGQDSFQSGVVCGRLMQMLVSGQGSIAVILVVPDDLHIRRRAAGFRS